MLCDFSYKHYDELMKLINLRGYKSMFFSECEVDKYILVRHDVDVDLDSAFELAKIEKENGIKSTYFIWLNSPFYNIFEARYKKIIEDIIKMGHEIGLHFDETAYSLNNIEEIKNAIYNEVQVIQGFFNIKIRVVSFHRPSQFVLNGDLAIDGLVNTYSEKFFKRYKYISDSKGIWREGCLCNLLNNYDYKNIQVVMHPVWWGEKHNQNQERILNFINYKLNKMSGDLSNNITTYKFKRFDILNLEQERRNEF